MENKIVKKIEVKDKVNWSNPPKVEDLKYDLEAAKENHIHISNKITEWLEVLNPIRTKKKTNRSTIKPRLVRKQNEWRYSSLEDPFLSSSNLFKVNPVTYADVESARQNEAILNKQFRVDINKVRFINKYIRMSVNTGTAIIKVGWKTQKANIKQIVQKPILSNNIEEISQFLQLQVQQGLIPPEMLEQVAMEANEILEAGEGYPIGVEDVEVMKEKKIFNGPTLEVKDPRRILIDPHCLGDYDNIKYIIDQFVTDIPTLKKDKSYFNLDYLESFKEDENNEYFINDFASSSSNYFNPNGYKENSIHETEVRSNFKDKARKKIVVNDYWGYWDIENNNKLELIHICFVKDVIIKIEKNPYPDKKFPYVIVDYLPVLESMYGESDASLLQDNQDVITAITRGCIDLLGRSANGQLALAKGALDVPNTKKFLNGENFEVNMMGASVKDILHMNSYPEIPNSALTLINMFNAEAESLTGVKAFNQGISGEALGKNVGGIKTAVDATSRRELSILRRLASGLIEVARKIIAMNAEFLDDEEIILITDDEEVLINKNQLSGDFDLEIDISTPEVDNQKASEISFMLQTIGNSVDFNIIKMLLVQLAELRKMPLLAKMLKEYEPQPDPLEQELKQLEIELKKAQIADLQAKSQENQVDVQLKQAKTQTELAKSRNLGSDADLKDLDFTERATGLEQDRELEKLDRKNNNKEKNNDRKRRFE